jgi:signal recognition particle subunit SRP54
VKGKITEINVAETLKDVRKALLDADVNYKVAKTIYGYSKEKALGQNVLTSVKPSQLMVKIVHDELARLMGGTPIDVELKSSSGCYLDVRFAGFG